MRIGPFRHRVAIQSQAVAQDAFGQPSGSWSTDATVWASVEPIKGREFIDAGQVQANVTHRVRMRYRSDITVTPAKRISHNSRILNIVHVANDRDINHGLELMCEEEL